MKKYLYLIPLSMVLIGCGGAPKQPIKQISNADSEFISSQPQELKPSFKKLVSEDDRNRVLNYQKVALDAYQLGYYDISTEYFDKALLDIESVYSNEENARKARSLWYEEGKKDYKGEPYERVMAYYYRGLLYLKNKDFENARASFRGAILQDAFAEEENNRCDFNLVVLLDAVSSKFSGNLQLFNDTLKDVKSINPNLVIPEKFNTVVLIETGNSPRKLSDGIGHSQLKFRRGKSFTEQNAVVEVNGKIYESQVLEDIFWQSTSRGGRYFDSILDGKAQYKKATGDVAESFGAISSTATLGSTIIGSDTLGSVGAGLGLISGLAILSSTSADARADTRYWNNIPDKVHVLFLDLPAGKHKLNINYLDKHKNIVDGLNQTKEISVDGDENFYVFSSRNRLSYKFK